MLNPVESDKAIIEKKNANKPKEILMCQTSTMYEY